MSRRGAAWWLAATAIQAALARAKSDLIEQGFVQMRRYRRVMRSILPMSLLQLAMLDVRGLTAPTAPSSRQWRAGSLRRDAGRDAARPLAAPGERELVP